MGNAKQFLEKVMLDETLRERIKNTSPEELVKIAGELGFEVTEDDLKEAERELRSEKAEGPEELDPDALDKVAGGVYWMGEDDDDGHELGCDIFYHTMEYSVKNGKWCVENYYTKPDRDYDVWYYSRFCKSKNNMNWQQYDHTI